jgi:hypothetical protein
MVGVPLAPTRASQARAEIGGANRAEPDRPQGLDWAELQVARGELYERSQGGSRSGYNCSSSS